MGGVMKISLGSYRRIFSVMVLTALLGLTSKVCAQDTSDVKAPQLSGSFSDLSFEPNKSGSKVKLKALLTLVNSGAKAARNVTAAVYLSSDATLDESDQLVVTLHLSDFADGVAKLKKSSQTTLPLKYKVPSLLGSFLAGQYVIVVLGADNLPVGTDNSTQIVIGPLPSIP